MEHLLIYDSSIGIGSVLVDCKSLASEQIIPLSGDAYIVPSQLKKIGRIYAIGANISQCQVQAASLRSLFQIDVVPIAKATPAAQTGAALMELWDDPIDLLATDLLQPQVINAGAVAENERVGIWLIDAPPKPVTGKIITLKFTSATTLTSEALTLCSLTASQNLVPGQYDVVGIRAKSAGAQFARLVIPGQAFRPGVVAVQNDQALDATHDRLGARGVLGTFDNSIGISAEFLSSSADTSETVWLDLIYKGGSPARQ